MTTAPETERTVPAADHERLATLALRVLDARKRYLDGRNGAQQHQLRAELTDHERRLQRVAENALATTRKPLASLFAHDVGGEG